MDVYTPLILLLLMFDLLVLGYAAKGEGKRGRKNNSAHDMLDRILEFYEKSDPPTLDKSTEVKLGIYVNSFYSISEQTMDFSVNFYLRQSWTDPRLAFTPYLNEAEELVEKMKVADELIDRLWVPDVFFRNEKRAGYHSITVNNRLMTLTSEGDLWYVSKISATLACPMKLQKYPLDTQKCPMMFESFGYTMDTMYFGWLQSPCEIDKDNQLPQFELVDHELFDCSQNYTGGAFPCLEIQFILRRDIGFFLIQVYVPSILIVILSWVSFWINVDAIPARVSLGLLTVLTMTTQSTAANNSLPRVSYIKAIDVWMSMCLIFVFTALLEYAVVNVISRKGVRTIKPVRRPPPPNMQKFQMDTPVDQERPRSRLNMFNCIKINVCENGNERREGATKGGDKDGKYRARKIDKISRKLFPLAFLLFNMIYWILYTIPGLKLGQ